MAEPAIGTGTWQIEFTDETMRGTAAAIAQNLSDAGERVSSPAPRIPEQATLGTPEVLITILVTAAAKSLIISGLHALEQVLERQASTTEDRRVQVILTGANQPVRRFPISLQALGKDALRQFITEIASAVTKL